MVRLDESKVTSQGQISIPKKVRQKLQLSPGDRVVFWEDEKNGRIELRASDWENEFTPEDWERFLAKTEKEPVSEYRDVPSALRHLDRIIAKSKKQKK